MGFVAEVFLSQLESGNSGGIHDLIADFLHPLSNKKNKTSKSDLGKKFIRFLNSAITIVRKRLLVSPSNLAADHAAELLDILRLCVNSMASLSSLLAVKPYEFHIQRIGLVTALDAWGRHVDAQSEALSILESFNAIQLGITEEDNRFVPGVEQGGADKKFGEAIGEIVFILAKCAFENRSEDANVYQNLRIQG